MKYKLYKPLLTLLLLLLLIAGELVFLFTLYERQRRKFVAFENIILFECHEAYAFGNSDVKEAVARIVRACADYIDEDDIDNPALVIFMNDIAKRKRGENE